MIKPAANITPASRRTYSRPPLARAGAHIGVRRAQSIENNVSEQRLQKAASWLLLIYAALVPIIPGVPVGSLVLAGIDLLFPATAILICLTTRRRPPFWAACVLVLVGLSFVSLSAIHDPRGQWDCLLRVIRLAETVAPLFLALNIERPLALFRKVFFVFAGSGTVSILIGFVLFWWQINLRSDQQKIIFDGAYLFRAGGIFGDSSAFGHLVASWFVVMFLGGPLIFSRIALRLLGPIAILMSAYALYATSSRSCLLNIGAAVLFGIFSRQCILWRQRIVGVVPTLTLMGVCIVIAVLAGAVGSIAFLYEHLNERFVEIFVTFISDPNGASSGRTELWSHHFALFLKSPLIGIGYKALYFVMDAPPDNNFIAVAVEVGIFGISALIAFYVGLFVSLKRNYQAGDMAAWILVGFWIGQIVHSFTVDIWTFWGSMPVVLLITGLLAVRQRSTAATRGATLPIRVAGAGGTPVS